MRVSFQVRASPRNRRSSFFVPGSLPRSPRSAPRPLSVATPPHAYEVAHQSTRPARPRPLNRGTAGEGSPLDPGTARISPHTVAGRRQRRPDRPDAPPRWRRRGCGSTTTAALLRPSSEMRVRGAPAIGIAGRLRRRARRAGTRAARRQRPRGGAGCPGSANPGSAAHRGQPGPGQWTGCWGVARSACAAAALVDEAKRIHEEDVSANRNIGRHGAAILGPGGVGADALQHRRAGDGAGTAPRWAWCAPRGRGGSLGAVYATETRPAAPGRPASPPGSSTAPASRLR